MSNQYRVKGRDAKTGNLIEIIMQADNIETAAVKASLCGLKIEAISLDQEYSSKPLPSFPPENTLFFSDTKPSKTKERGCRWWMFSLGIFVLFFTLFFPSVSLIFGIIILLPCIGVFVPQMQKVSLRMLKLNSDDKLRKIICIILYGLLGIFFIVISGFAYNFKIENKRIAEKKDIDKVKQQRLVNEANSQVKTLVQEAEIAWGRSDTNLAMLKLQIAEKTKHATNLSSVNQLRTKMANTEVQLLISQTKEALKEGNLDLAIQKIKTALSVPHTTEQKTAREIQEKIENETNPERIRNLLINLSDESFVLLKEKGTLPPEIVSGYEGLDRITYDLACKEMEFVVDAREKRRQEQKKHEQDAIEAASKAEADRKAKAMYEAEVKRKEERKNRIEKCFSVWDGSHKGMTQFIKYSMNNPKSYEHVSTTYWDNGDYLVVRTTFRGTNAFGGVVKNQITAKVDLDGNVLEIIEQGP